MLWGGVFFYEIPAEGTFDITAYDEADCVFMTGVKSDVHLTAGNHAASSWRQSSPTVSVCTAMMTVLDDNETPDQMMNSVMAAAVAARRGAAHT